MADPSIAQLFSSHFLSTRHLHFSTLADCPEFRIIYLSRLPTKVNNWASINVITINRSSCQCISFGVIIICGAETEMKSVMEEEERRDRRYIKDRGGSCGENAVEDRQWQVKALSCQIHLHMKGALCHSKHDVCISNNTQTQKWEFIHCYMSVSLLKQVLRGQIVIILIQLVLSPPGTQLMNRSCIPE